MYVKIPMLGTHDQYFFPGPYARASLETRDPARKWAMPIQQEKGRREVSSGPRAGGHEATKTGQVSKRSCSGPSTFPVGEDRTGKRKQMRGAVRDKGNSGHSREKRLKGMKQ